MFDDPIVEEIRRVRHAHASQFGNDLTAIVVDLVRLQREGGRTYVNLPPRRVENPSSQSGPQPRRKRGR